MKYNQYSVSFIAKLFVSYFIVLIIISMIVYLRQTLNLLNILLFNKPSAKNVFVLLTSLLPTTFLTSIPFAICIGISVGTLIIKDIRTQVFEKTKGSFVIIMFIGFIVSLTCILIREYILPDSVISFSNTYRSILLNDYNIIFERNSNNPREMRLTQIIQEINLLSEKMRENNRMLNIYIDMNFKKILQFH